MVHVCDGATFQGSCCLGVNEVVDWITNDLTDSERADLLARLSENICMHCGTADPTCQCWNDE